MEISTTMVQSLSDLLDKKCEELESLESEIQKIRHDIGNARLCLKFCLGCEANTILNQQDEPEQGPEDTIVTVEDSEIEL